jgi:hypothetical protein
LAVLVMASNSSELMAGPKASVMVATTLMRPCRRKMKKGAKCFCRHLNYRPSKCRHSNGMYTSQSDQSVFCQNYYTTFTLVKSSPQIFVYFCNSQNHKTNHPKGENSPSLVTLNIDNTN